MNGSVLFSQPATETNRIRQTAMCRTLSLRGQTPYCAGNVGASRLPSAWAGTERGAPFDAPLSVLDQADYAQVITPFDMVHVFADCVCVAEALHDGGGPARLVALIVTFCDGVNPWRGAAIVATPPK